MHRFNGLSHDRYPADWKREDEPYYPINDEKNNIFAKYQEEASKNDKVIFCGRLADYKYWYVVIGDWKS